MKVSQGNKIDEATTGEREEDPKVNIDKDREMDIEQAKAGIRDAAAKSEVISSEGREKTQCIVPE